MGIDLGEYDADPYDVYMDELTSTERNKVLGPKEKKGVRWWWVALWLATLPFSLAWWPIYPAVRKVIRHIRKPRV